MIVGGLQDGDLTLARRAGFLQIRASPRKPLPPEFHHYKIRHETGVATASLEPERDVELYFAGETDPPATLLLVVNRHRLHGLSVRVRAL